MSRRPVVVLKFGGSVLTGDSAYRAAAAEVVRRASDRAVVAVVSARSGTTEALIASARELVGEPGPAPLSGLLATGEIASACLLALALQGSGCAAAVLTPHQIGLRTRGPRLDGRPVEVDRARIRRALLRGPVVIPGFVGLGTAGAPTLLGRGGSDLTALFLAHRLRATECVLLKDVDGLHESDPKEGSCAAPVPHAGWRDVLRLGGGLVQPKAVRWAERHGVSFRIAGLGGVGTDVGPRGATAGPCSGMSYFVESGNSGSSTS